MSSDFNSHRSDIFQERERLGDVEIDLTMGKEQVSAFLVMTERSTLVTTLGFLQGKGCKVVQEPINSRIESIGSSWINTMTSENGKEFTAKIAKKIK